MSESDYSSDDGDTREGVSFDERDRCEDDSLIDNDEHEDNGEDEDDEEYDEDEDSEDDNEESDYNSNDDEDGQSKEEMPANRAPGSAGNAIASQFELFDGLMGMRIRQQEMLMNVNKLPQPRSYQQFKTNIGQSFSSSTKGVKRCLQQMLDNLLDLQEKLMEADNIGIPLKKRKLSDDDGMDEEITSDEDDVEDDKADEDVNGSNEDDDEIEAEESDALEANDITTATNHNFEELINKRHSSLRMYRTQLLKELSEKVKFAPSNAKHGDFKSLNIPINKQIDQVLEKKESLIERTQTKRLVYKVIGKEVDQLAQGTETECKVVIAKDPEIFDDYDFYCRLMNDLTNRKIANTRDMVEISRRWAELNNLRTKSIKKSLVDHNASKGRKTRYNIIKRLIGLPDIELATPMDNKECDAIFNQIFNQSEAKSGQSWLFKPMES